MFITQVTMKMGTGKKNIVIQMKNGLIKLAIWATNHGKRDGGKE